MKIKIIWNNTTIAESEDFRIVESCYYFPPSSVKMQFLKKNGNQHVSRWKGTADLYDIVVDDKTNEAAALSYSCPNEGLEKIEGYISFGKSVEVVREKNGKSF